MKCDKNTLQDLSVFLPEGLTDIFALADRTVTQAGREELKHLFLEPPATLQQLLDRQAVVKFWVRHTALFPVQITNGTMVMLGQFFESSDNMTTPPGGFTLFVSQLFHKVLLTREVSVLHFSLTHLKDLFAGCNKLVELLALPDVPDVLVRELQLMSHELTHPLIGDLLNVQRKTPFDTLTKLRYRARRELKNIAYQLMNSFARIDAWHSMAVATAAHGWQFPDVLAGEALCYHANGLYHPLLKHPVSYDLNFNKDRNFMVLTGANMSGKTTFLRAMGVGALLAHTGMGVPAHRMQISFLQNIITHMQVHDDILKGESYFYAEVMRMKHTAEKIVAPEPCLVLMDELFKGTNVHDAYDCTRAVIEGLLHYPRHIMVLSTHLYEVAQQFSSAKNITFAHFITDTDTDGAYRFNYQLLPGISDDRIGYKILEREGVITLLKSNNA